MQNMLERISRLHYKVILYFNLFLFEHSSLMLFFCLKES